MALNTQISAAAAIEGVDALADGFDVGAGVARIEIRSGTQPANVGDAPADGALLATLNLANPAFGAGADAAPGGQAAAQPIVDDTSADAGGTASYFIGYYRNGAARIQGTVGDTGVAGVNFDMVINTVSIVALANVSISSWILTVPES